MDSAAPAQIEVQPVPSSTAVKTTIFLPPWSNRKIRWTSLINSSRDSEDASGGGETRSALGIRWSGRLNELKDSKSLDARSKSSKFLLTSVSPRPASCHRLLACWHQNWLSCSAGPWTAATESFV